MTLVFGLADPSSWLDSGFGVLVQGSHLQVERLDGGSVECLKEVADLSGGSWVAGPLGILVEDAGWNRRTSRGSVAWMEVVADQAYDVTFSGPDGFSWNPTYSVQGRQINRTFEVFCGGPGEWDVNVRKLQGTMERWTYVRAVVVDVPRSLQEAFDCAGKAQTI